MFTGRSFTPINAPNRPSVCLLAQDGLPLDEASLNGGLHLVLADLRHLRGAQPAEVAQTRHTQERQSLALHNSWLEKELKEKSEQLLAHRKEASEEVRQPSARGGEGGGEAPAPSPPSRERCIRFSLLAETAPPARPYT